MTTEELNIQIQQKQADIKKLISVRNDILYKSLTSMVGKYYQNKCSGDYFFFVEFISKETIHPFGIEIDYNQTQSGYMHIIEDWSEITKEEFEKGFNDIANRLRKKLKL